MSNMVKHAEREFKSLGWQGDDETQRWVCDNILELLKVFSEQGHSGSSAQYVLNLFERLARFKPISPLTGEDDEWNELQENMYQNNRDGEVFKKDGKAYWISGKIFKDKDGCTFTNRDSWVDVVFPWVHPESEIVEVDE